MHSENGIYKCDRCSDTFTSYLDFKSHRNTHHSINGSNSSTVIAQTAELRTQPMQQIQSPQPHTTTSQTTTSISTRSSVSDTCDFEVMIDETKIQKPGPGESHPEQRPGVVATAPSVPMVTAPEQEVILVDEEASSSTAAVRLNSKPSLAPGTVVTTMNSNIVSSGSVVTTSSISAVPTSNSVPTVITNGIDKNSLHRQLLQQIEESEANSTGPKIYKCDTCPKTFVHLNNLKAHIYAEHDNDKPFKCKLCPISFKTKEILVMHMVLHSQHNTAT